MGEWKEVQLVNFPITFMIGSVDEPHGEEMRVISVFENDCIGLYYVHSRRNYSRIPYTFN